MNSVVLFYNLTPSNRPVSRPGGHWMDAGNEGIGFTESEWAPSRSTFEYVANHNLTRGPQDTYQRMH